MALLLAAAWAFGGAVRHNIAHVEGRGDLGPGTRALDRMSEMALIFAYLVSVAYYLTLLGGFAYPACHGRAPTATWCPWISTVLIVVIAALAGPAGSAA